MTEPDTTYYHLTPASNLTAIGRQGLIPRRGPRSRSAHEARPVIYLFADMATLDDALANWLGESFEDIPLALLEVTLPSRTVRRVVAFEVQVGEAVPPAAIKVISRDYGR